MNLFDVYPLFNIEIVKGKGCHVWDSEGTEYLDLYGGHIIFLNILLLRYCTYVFIKV